MPEIPRDPRQLARDILAGKVRIEDLAKERGMRPPAATPREARVPDKVPLPRPVPPRPPVQRAPAQVRPVARPKARPVPPVARQVPTPAPGIPPSARPTPAVPASVYTLAPQRAAPVEPLAPIAPRGPAAPETMASAMGQKPTPRAGKVARLLGSKGALRQGIILSEILGKPVSMRDE